MAREPLLLIPGLGGSTLDSPPLFLGLGGYSVWCNPALLIAGHLDRMRLAVPGESRPLDPRPPLVKNGPLSAYYGPLAAFLMAQGFAVDSVALDWRGSYHSDGAYLAAYVRQAYPGGGVRLLCHSRGGLVARAACKLLQATGHLGRIERVVCLGTPHTGALPAVAALCGYGSAERSIEGLASYFPPSVAGNVRPSIVRDVIRSWPGVYELLPAPTADWLQPEVRAALYQPATYAGSPLNVVSAYLSLAAASWAALPSSFPGVDWYDVAGYGVDTLHDLLSAEGVVDDPQYATGPAGDGVVPQSSAFGPASKHVGTPTGHNALPFDARLWAALVPILRSGRESSLYLSGSVLAF